MWHSIKHLSIILGISVLLSACSSSGGSANPVPKPPINPIPAQPVTPVIPGTPVTPAKLESYLLVFSDGSSAATPAEFSGVVGQQVDGAVTVTNASTKAVTLDLPIKDASGELVETDSTCDAKLQPGQSCQLNFAYTATSKTSSTGNQHQLVINYQTTDKSKHTATWYYDTYATQHFQVVLGHSATPDAEKAVIYDKTGKIVSDTTIPDMPEIDRFVGNDNVIAAQGKNADGATVYAIYSFSANTWGAAFQIPADAGTTLSRATVVVSGSNVWAYSYNAIYSLTARKFISLPTQFTLPFFNRIEPYNNGEFMALSNFNDVATATFDPATGQWTSAYSKDSTFRAYQLLTNPLTKDASVLGYDTGDYSSRYRYHVHQSADPAYWSNVSRPAINSNSPGFVIDPYNSENAWFYSRDGEVSCSNPAGCSIQTSVLPEIDGFKAVKSGGVAYDIGTGQVAVVTGSLASGYTTKTYTATNADMPYLEKIEVTANTVWALGYNANFQAEYETFNLSGGTAFSSPKTVKGMQYFHGIFASDDNLWVTGTDASTQVLVQLSDAGTHAATILASPEIQTANVAGSHFAYATLGSQHYAITQYQFGVLDQKPATVAMNNVLPHPIVSAGRAWLLGRTQTEPSQSAYMYFDGLDWSTAKTLPNNLSVSMATPTKDGRLWVVGRAGTEEQAVFFNGESWDRATTVPKMAAILNFVANGNHAVVVGLSSTGSIQYSYFNGSVWSTPQAASSLQFSTLRVQNVAGYTWIVGRSNEAGEENNIYAYVLNGSGNLVYHGLLPSEIQNGNIHLHVNVDGQSAWVMGGNAKLAYMKLGSSWIVHNAPSGFDTLHDLYADANQIWVMDFNESRIAGTTNGTWSSSEALPFSIGYGNNHVLAIGDTAYVFGVNSDAVTQVASSSDWSGAMTLTGVNGIDQVVAANAAPWALDKADNKVIVHSDGAWQALSSFGHGVVSLGVNRAVQFVE